MLDQIEQWEDSAERQYDEILQTDGKLKCGCGKCFDPNSEGGTLSPNPYAMPVCGECLHKALSVMSPS